MNFGFIGLGNMGFGMATNLLNYCKDNGHQLVVYDINDDKVDSLKLQGASAAKDHSDLASQVDVLFTSLPGAPEVNQLAEGENGILNSLRDGAVWFETSTNDLSEWEKLIRLAPSAITLIDAPVTGGSEGAAAGTLTMLLGVDANLLDEFQIVLESFTARAIRMGPSGAGYVAKLCQLHLNYLVAQGIGEALMLGAKADLDLAVLHRVLQNSCAQSYVVDNYIPKILDGSYDPSFTLGLACKDMRLISELGEHLDMHLELGAAVHSTYQTAVSEYGGGEPHLKIVKLIEDKLDLQLRAE